LDPASGGCTGRGRSATYDVNQVAGECAGAAEAAGASRGRLLPDGFTAIRYSEHPARPRPGPLCRSMP
jgi:hypothetical protein